MAGTDTSVGERTVRDELGKEGKDLEWQAQKLELYSLCAKATDIETSVNGHELICIFDLATAQETS